ncbi:SIS domain-containing protein [Mangrovactinospora gilvigrisea]|uniref:SIS domain-containing protein n=1 Tax=Mangrovactinospora gilvigrisea TaxID=1428644 RepID=A0A1J7BZ69_9ACTN|nr:SIS domain-containing protein [Mangrovactinospora gilvigrisea]OIV38777.1 SIS domain-containing protein [Mangrovactinospora gilvigrisea]
MSDLVGEYFDAAQRQLEQVRKRNGPSVGEAARRIADAVEGGGALFAFGAGHSSLPAQDLVYRAGGLALFNLLAVPGLIGVDVMPAPLGSALERVAGLAEAALDASPARAGDLLIVVSLSGRNVVPVEMARHAREKGMTVIAVTSEAYAESPEVTAKHPSGTFLRDNADVVLDTAVAPGDAELSADGLPTRFGSVSTVVACALLQAAQAAAVALLHERGATVPLLRSGNVDGGLEWNARLFAEHGDRIFYRR